MNELTVKISRKLNALKFEFEGVESLNHHASRLLTGTDNEGTNGNENGIFNYDGETTFFIGEFSKTFQVPQKPKTGTMDEAKEYLKALVLVIKKIRAWVAECKSSDAEETVTVLL